ncbi:MAG TPA: GvpL/GvpF family gas vesicle protein [Pyrinomonadaceae bacterium]|jgi:hypothetical protein
MSLYAYCLSDEVEPSMLDGCAGLGGGRLRLIREGEIAVVVSEFEGARAEATAENASAHNRVASHVLASVTPLPFRFGTIASEARLRRYVEENREALSKSLVRVRGCVEMSVKILRDVAASSEGAQEQANALRANPCAQTSAGRGAAYLAAKRREMLGRAALKEQAEEIASWLAAALGDALRESRVRVNGEDALAVRAAHLVERARLEDYRERLRRARAEREPVLRFLTSGAWPPYSFSDAQI